MMRWFLIYLLTVLDTGHGLSSPGGFVVDMNEIREAMLDAGYYDDDADDLDVELERSGEPKGGPDSCPLCPAELPRGRVPDHIRESHS